MPDVQPFISQYPFLASVAGFLSVVLYFLLAWLIHRLAWRIAGLLLRLNDYVFPQQFPLRVKRFGQPAHLPKGLAELNRWLPGDPGAAHELRVQRRQTLRELLANAVSLAAFIGAIILSLHLFLEAESIILIVSLFGSALAFAGRTFIGDLLAGISIIFQDKLAVGEKILVKAQFELLEGVVEHVDLNATWLRADTGELYIIQNGEMRFIRNYSRGLHSSANITLKIPATDLDRALPLLKSLGQEAVKLLPTLKEPWKVISETGSIGQNTELTLVVKTTFGEAAALRPQLLRLVQKRLALADIPLVG
jgi:small-conductance mechanosensitive channel